MDRNYVTKFQYKCSGLFIFRCYNTKDVYRVSLSEVFDLKNSVYLNNDIEMPLLGLGVYKITDQSEANTAVRAAVQAGYRLIDTATVYKNEEQIGTAIAKSGITQKGKHKLGMSKGLCGLGLIHANKAFLVDCLGMSCKGRSCQSEGKTHSYLIHSISL